jgi:hypothetical protein
MLPGVGTMRGMHLAMGCHSVALGCAILLAATVAGGVARSGEPGAVTNAGGDADRQTLAFRMFEQLRAVVDLPAGDPKDPFAVVGIDRRSRQVDLGQLRLEDLAAVSFRLAVPEETTAGQPFQAEIVAVDQADGGYRWEIRQVNGRSPLGVAAGPERLATLADHDGRLILEVERACLGSRSLAILRRCVILAEALDPTTRRLAVREIRLVTPTKVRPLVSDAEDGLRTLILPVPAGIGSRDVVGDHAAVNLALPVNGVELEAEWGGQPVSMRWPRQAADSAGPGVGQWTIAVAQLGHGAEVGMTVTISLAHATLECKPVLMEEPGKGFSEEAWAEFQERRSRTIAAIEKKFRARVAACPLRDRRRAGGRAGPADLVANWFDAPLATEQAMVVGMPGHETARNSLDIYLKEEYERIKQELEAAWQKRVAAMPDAKTRDTTEYFGPPLPDVPRDFAAWQARWAGVKEAEWEALFTARLDAWSDWFWRRFQARWNQGQAAAGQALSKPAELRIVRITSIARDAAGIQYPVPLVVTQPAVAPLGGGLPDPPPPAGRKKRGNPPEEVTP